MVRIQTGNQFGSLGPTIILIAAFGGVGYVKASDVLPPFRDSDLPK